MTWITTIPYDSADPSLRKIYDRVKGPDNNVDNILMAHSLRPHTLTGHMTLYKNVLHHTGNTLPKWFLETLGTYVSYLNKCQYCIDHHFTGLKRLLNDEKLASTIWQSIVNDNPGSSLDRKYNHAFPYTKKLTLDPGSVSPSDIIPLKGSLSDGEILEINQVVSYFCYANRTVLGLGVNTDGDILGLSPNESSDPNNWGHQ